MYRKSEMVAVLLINNTAIAGETMKQDAYEKL
jgi:hypothetical protein